MSNAHFNFWECTFSHIKWNDLVCCIITFQSIAEFAHPANEFMEIKKENEETVDITFNASPEKICQKDTYFAGDKASDFHLWCFTEWIVSQIHRQLETKCPLVTFILISGTSN